MSFPLLNSESSCCTAEKKKSIFFILLIFFGNNFLKGIIDIFNVVGFIVPLILTFS